MGAQRGARRAVQPARHSAALRLHILRAGEGSPTRAEESELTAALLASCAPQARSVIYRFCAESGRARRSDPHLPGTTEHVVLTAGRASAGPVDQAVELDVCDYVSSAATSRTCSKP